MENSIIVITTAALMFGSDIVVSKACKSVDRIVVDVEAKFVDMAIKEDCGCTPGASNFKDRAGTSAVFVISWQRNPSCDGEYIYS